MYKNILVPVDVYETGTADKALQHAQFTRLQKRVGIFTCCTSCQNFPLRLTRGVCFQMRERWMNIVNNSKRNSLPLVKN